MFETNENLYLIEKENSNTYQYLKFEFLKKCDLSSKVDYYLSLSSIYANIKLNNCEYSESVMNLISSIIS